MFNSNIILFYLWYNRNLCLVFGLGKAFLAVYSGAPVMLTSSAFPPHWAYAKRLTRPREPHAVSWPPGRPVIRGETIGPVLTSRERDCRLNEISWTKNWGIFQAGECTDVLGGWRAKKRHGSSESLPHTLPFASLPLVCFELSSL